MNQNEICCPSCGSDLIMSERMVCSKCGAKYSVDNGIPLLFFQIIGIGGTLPTELSHFMRKPRFRTTKIWKTPVTLFKKRKEVFLLNY
jgi:hypothetical protein